jgi:hypothetical protein
MHKAQPSSYSAKMRIVSPTLMDNSSGRLVINVHTTVAEKGDIDRVAAPGEYTVALNPPLGDQGV